MICIKKLKSMNKIINKRQMNKINKIMIFNKKL